MTDPLVVLGGPDLPVAPRPEFTARLRARLERAVALPRGVTVSDLDVNLDLDPAPRREVAGREVPAPLLVPYLAVAGARAALDFYVAAFGAERRDEPIVMPDGRIGHAELVLPGGAHLMLSDEHPEIGVTAPRPEAGASVTLHFDVRDVDAVMVAAVAAGAAVEREAADHPYGRSGVLRDPYGHRWMIAGPSRPAVAADAAQGLAAGEIGYVSLWVPDAERAGAFFASVLGWSYAGGAPRSRQVTGRSLPHGIWGGVDPATLLCCFAVADVDEASERVRDAGGTAGDPADEPYGRVATCADDQGVPFALFTPPGGVVAPRVAPTPELGPGDLVYVTLEVVDSARTRAFFAAVLGWEWDPGSVPDGWRLRSAPHRIGLSGGHAEATSVPMYAVSDVDAAVERVRAAGGVGSEPETHPYGRSSSCRDDQGTRFHLGQV